MPLLPLTEAKFLNKLAAAAKIGDNQADRILLEFGRPRAQVNMDDFRGLLERLATVSHVSRSCVDQLLPQLETREPIDTLSRLLRLYMRHLDQRRSTADSAAEAPKKTAAASATSNRRSSSSGAESSASDRSSASTKPSTAADAKRMSTAVKGTPPPSLRGSLKTIPVHSNVDENRPARAAIADTSGHITESSLSDVRRRISEAASTGLSKSACSRSDLPPFDPDEQLMPAALDKENRSDVPPADFIHPIDYHVPRFEDEPTALRRRHTLWHFNETVGTQFPRVPAAVAALPAHCQERRLIEELLYSFLGCGGSLIRAEPGAQYAPNVPDAQRTTVFRVSDEVNESLRQQVGNMLEVGQHYTRISDFLVRIGNEYHLTTIRNTPLANGPYEHRCWGPVPTLGSCGEPIAHAPRGSQITQALAAAMRSLLADFMQTVVALEADIERLTLSRLYHRMRPSMLTLATMARVVDLTQMGRLHGPLALGKLHEELGRSVGNEAVQAVTEHLLERSAVPFMHNLQLWLVKAVVYDPHAEFMIVMNAVHADAAAPDAEELYWTRRYLMQRDNVPSFLVAVADVVMLTGKYLNVIRQCGHNVVVAGPDTGPAQSSGDAAAVVGELRFSAKCDNYLAFIYKAYHSASRRLMDLMLVDNDLLGHLRSVKRYLLMEQGDFIEQFMDVVEDELNKNIDLAMPIKLENLLGLVLRTTSARNDRYMDALRIQIYDCDLYTQMNTINAAGVGRSSAEALKITCFEGFSFDYEVSWPVSLVVNLYALESYKCVFRMLFYFKHVRRQLNRMWIHSKNVKRFERKRMSDVQRRMFSLSHRMMHVMQNIENYLVQEVIEPLWQKFLVKMETVENFDKVITAHGNFTDELMEGTMIREPEVLRTLIEMCKLSLWYGGMVMKQTELRESEEFGRRVIKSNDMFNELIVRLLSRIGTNKRFVNLVHRLNFNSFYSDK